MKQEEMSSVASEILFGLVMLVICVSVLFYMELGFGIARTDVDRKVFEKSYQRSEGLKTKIATMQTQLAGIKVQLETEKDTNIINDLKKQKAMLTVQIKSTMERK